ncbi:MAG: translation elongation factor 4 [Patescibacteria group bacterium]
MNNQHIRNFCIIAHIDHGKSTLADRLLEITGTIEKRKMQEQVLDQMDLERERGITIKLQPVQMRTLVNGEEYELNLIDTPGHVDFTYEVSRSLQACEGALLVVDATQGIQAQTLANLYLALEQDLEIIPVINKIDLPAAQPDHVADEVSHLLGVPKEDMVFISARTGLNVEAVIQKIVEKVPPPTGEISAPLKALIFDSVFDDYRGVVTYVRVEEGSIQAGSHLRLMGSDATSDALEVGVFTPKMKVRPVLNAGEIGYIVTGFKDVKAARVGDTVTLVDHPATQALPGYKTLQPMVYAGIFIKEGSEYEHLRDAIGKLKLNDAALSFEPEHSPALGFGFRCGFLGLLHLDIVQERLRREYNLDVIVTVPSVAYRITQTNGQVKIIASPLALPDPSVVKLIEEPWMKVDIVSPVEYIGAIMALLVEKRGKPRDQELEYVDPTRVIIHYSLPLSQIVVDFYDRLKNVSSGYASMGYDFIGFEPADVQRMDIIVAEEMVEALSTIIYKDEAQRAGRVVVEELKKMLPRQMFEVKIQASIGSKIVASERIPAMRKDVTAKLYGGDLSRKRKLLEKQKKGKAKMKSLGKVDIPQEAFLAVLKR